jgi:hypothetical protein
MPFDFDAAVNAPFRMQPGLRRLAPGTPQLTPMAPGSPTQREKLAVLSAYWGQALLAREGFDARPALAVLFAQAAIEHPDAWAWDGSRAHALRLGTAVRGDGGVEALACGGFGVGDEVQRCLGALPAHWRQVGLANLAFAQDLALIDGSDGTIPWLAVTLPSHWAPEEKVGQHFASVHAPVADNAMLLKAADSLARLVTGGERWERFVWSVTDHPRHHAHPARTSPQRWRHTEVSQAWWRTEHQTFIPVPGLTQALFTIHVEVARLADAIDTPGRARKLHDAVASMSDAVLAYRGLAAVRTPLLAWLGARAADGPPA